MRVYIIAASPLTRAAIENLLAGRTVSVVGSGGSLEAVSDQILEAEPDAVVLHLADKTTEFLEVLAASHLANDVTVVALLDATRPGLPSDLLRAGVRAILPTQITREQLLAALQAAIAGLIVLDSVRSPALFSEPALLSASLAEPTEPLTPREREVLQMLAGGLANKEIAAKLSISDHTAKFHVASILGKLGAASRAEAVAIGIRRGLVLL